MKIYLFLLFFVFLSVSVSANTLDDAQREYLYGDYQAAILIAKQLPETPEVLYFLGLTYMKMGEYSQARAVLRKVIRTYRNSSVYEAAIVKFSDAYFLEGHLEKARSLYEEIDRKYPVFNYKPHVYLRLAQIASKKGEWSKKRKYINLVNHKFPDSSERIYADILRERGDFFTIQIGAFSGKENALGLKQELEKKDYDVYLIEDKQKSYTLYKVRVGKYKERTRVNQVFSRLIDQGYPARIYP